MSASSVTALPPGCAFYGADGFHHGGHSFLLIDDDVGGLQLFHVASTAWLIGTQPGERKRCPLETLPLMMPATRERMICVAEKGHNPVDRPREFELPRPHRIFF